MTDLSDLVARDEVISSLRKKMSLEQSFYGLLGQSAVMLRLFDLIAAAAQSDAPVLITGESGTGKELVARAIHEIGPRSGGPYITVNCAALNDALLESELFGHVKGAFTGADRQRTGRFEAGSGGDIFLDEIGDLPLNTQVKLLRVLQEKVIERVGEQTPIPVDVRILTATNTDIRALMAEGKFREDLFYRIGVIPIQIPSLRERREDIPLLVETFIRRISGRGQRNISGISQSALDLMVNHHWSGNVRELINVVEYAFVLCRDRIIKPEHLPAELSRPAPCTGQGAYLPPAGGGEREKQELIKVLEQTKGRKGRAAELLGVSRVTLWKRMKKHGLS